MVAQNIAFAMMAAVIVVGAIRVVTVNNVVHAALWLVVVLAGVAGQYILLAAEFVAVTQVLVYIGAIVVLFLFGTMLTRAGIGRQHQLTHRQWASGLAVALVVMGTMTYVLLDEFGDEELPAEGAIFSTAEVSDSVFGVYLLPFWALGLLLLAALIGAVVLVRRD